MKNSVSLLIPSFAGLVEGETGFKTGPDFDKLSLMGYKIYHIHDFSIIITLQYRSS